MARVLVNNDVSSLYPNLVRIYGYSSRNQKDKDSYVKILKMRMDAKHNKLSQEFLDSLNVTNSDIKDGLKLIINSYTGTLRAEFNALNDPLQGVSICFTGQCLLLQLGYDLMQIPTVHLSRFNTDAVEVSVEEEYVDEVYRVVHEWEKLTNLEMEDDKIVKLVARDINNYTGIYKVKDGYEVHYKGSDLTRGEHKFKWNKEKKIFEYSFKDSLKSNSMSIVSEALLKFLLFDIPIRDTIEKCDDIFRFQIISHLGSTYERMVQESGSGDIELQRNNRIYAGKKPSGNILKVKSNGRRDSLANCPPNPVVDNANECTIGDVNKEWYIQFAEKKANAFLGIKKLEKYKKEELLEMANDLGLDIDKKTKKSDIIEMIKNNKRNEVSEMATKQELEEKLEKSMEQNEKLINKIKEMEGNNNMQVEINNDDPMMTYESLLLKKINNFRHEIRGIEFIYDKELPSNLGGGEYYSIDQFYNAIQETCLKVGLDFSFETTDLLQFDKELTKPSGKLPIHVATVRTVATFTDIDTGYTKRYITVAQGSDTIDKAVASASSMAFRNWFYKNFTPKNMNEEEIERQEPVEKSTAPKVPVYVPEAKKEEIKKEVVKQEQHEESDDEDVKAICENIMKIREVGTDKDGNDLSEYGAKTLEKIMSGTLTSADLLEIDLKVKNKMEKVGL